MLIFTHVVNSLAFLRAMLKRAVGFPFLNHYIFFLLLHQLISSKNRCGNHSKLTADYERERTTGHTAPPLSVSTKREKGKKIDLAPSLPPSLHCSTCSRRPKTSPTATTSALLSLFRRIPPMFVSARIGGKRRRRRVRIQQGEGGDVVCPP